ncbi:MAG: 16S rRNA (cytosine(967)-C(5))-methyltransferase RsmB [Proteobacteria bacterium]|nr:16S rRNA (cytosine(967)-C(5))-methyltransferase RsmB [Pseudomonadota bacterium]
MTDDARITALSILNALGNETKTLNWVLEDVLGKEPQLSRKDLKLVYAMVYGVLRWRGRIDWVIDHFSGTRLEKIEPKVLNILRLGLFQVIFLNRIPVSAAVNTSVEMTKTVAAPWVVRYVNGLLRTAVKKYQDVPFPDTTNDPVSALAAKKSFPKWLCKRWLDRFGFKETELLCDILNTIPPITVRTNTLKTTRQILMDALSAVVEKITPTEFGPDGISFFNPRISIKDIESFQKGWFQVQDEAAQLVTLLLAPQPGETVLDVCAGLGGKTGHIGQMMKNRGRLIAVDRDRQKLLQLGTEMNRLGISIVETFVHDLDTPFNHNHLKMFDRILIDAPCSGLGVIRRNPDTKWMISKQNLAYYQEKQMRFLNHLAHLIKPLGVLVFAVCSTEPEENEAVIKGFLNKHDKFVIERNPVGLPPEIRSLVDEYGFLKTFPQRHNMDGFFAVCLRRIN